MIAMVKKDLMELHIELVHNFNLTSREAQVTEMVTQGLSNKEIANQLFITEATVKAYLVSIYKKMKVESRAQLIVWCLRYLGGN